LQYERIRKGALLTLAASVVIVAVLQSLGITDSITAQDRTAAFEANENLIADVLSLGLLIVVGLAYGRAKTDLKSRLLFWLFGGVLAVMIVVTGSRGAMIALLLALLVFFLHDKDLRVKLKVGSAVVLAVGVLGWLSYAIEPVRERWEKTYYEGDTAGREVIFAAAWEMFLEKPLTGWGPGYNISELGSRLGLRHDRDTHNIYLWLLTEAGLLGTAFFLAGLWFCWHAAWKARSSIQGALPMALLLFLLIVGMKGTIHTDKFFWVVLAYAVASTSGGSAGRAGNQQTAGSLDYSGKLRRPPQIAT
jgi:O-antigen ligase